MNRWCICLNRQFPSKRDIFQSLLFCSNFDNVPKFNPSDNNVGRVLYEKSKVLNSIKVDDRTYCERECRCFSLIEIKTICFCRYRIDRVGRTRRPAHERGESCNLLLICVQVDLKQYCSRLLLFVITVIVCRYFFS